MEYKAKDNLNIMKFAKNYNNFIIKKLLNIIEKNSFKKILDFGCADGYFIENLKKITNLNIIGIDNDVESILICKNKNIQIFKNLEEINYKFDFIYSLNTLEHIFNDLKILKHFNSKLKNNGKIFLYLPAFQKLFSSMDKKTGHFRRYNKKAIKKKLIKAGFKIEKIEYCDFLGIIATVIYIIKDKIKPNNGNINKIQIKFYDKIFIFSRFLDKFFHYFAGKNLMIVASKI